MNKLDAETKRLKHQSAEGVSELSVPLEETELDLLSGDLLSYRKSKPVYPESGEHPVWGKVVRVSPKSYGFGFDAGVCHGFAIGLTLGMLIMCLVLINIGGGD